VLKAAEFKASQALSLAGAVIAASAHRQSATLVHKDPEFEAVAGQVRQERLPLKASRRSG
jgi:predicted nucleic acid-binding protein